MCGMIETDGVANSKVAKLKQLMKDSASLGSQDEMSAEVCTQPAHTSWEHGSLSIFMLK